MGNYADFEYEFIERTLQLISQYEKDLNQYDFYEQYNYTLLLNCLTGLIVMPKERIIDAIPNDRLLSQMKKEMGLQDTQINPDFVTVKDLAIALRHCVAHFSIKVESVTPAFLVDNIVFYDNQKAPGYIVATFKANELQPFVRYYGSWLLSNLQTKKKFKLGAGRLT
ncbi:HEPN family nuclease [Mucilaginibacter sp.]|uniref:HEPN family nuclease n=1 Tax=Mucilaginibacter sp. TaxID=1882438 RepID=UPI0025D91F1C|nr:HEPN family nuclease [Mucilaginibacter sp.]